MSGIYLFNKGGTRLSTNTRLSAPSKKNENKNQLLLDILKEAKVCKTTKINTSADLSANNVKADKVWKTTDLELIQALIYFYNKENKDSKLMANMETAKYILNGNKSFDIDEASISQIKTNLGIQDLRELFQKAVEDKNFDSKNAIEKKDNAPKQLNLGKSENFPDNSASLENCDNYFSNNTKNLDIGDRNIFNQIAKAKKTTKLNPSADLSDLNVKADRTSRTTDVEIVQALIYFYNKENKDSKLMANMETAIKMLKGDEDIPFSDNDVQEIMNKQGVSDIKELFKKAVEDKRKIELQMQWKHFADKLDAINSILTKGNNGVIDLTEIQADLEQLALDFFNESYSEEIDVQFIKKINDTIANLSIFDNNESVYNKFQDNEANIGEIDENIVSKVPEETVESQTQPQQGISLLQEETTPHVIPAISTNKIIKNTVDILTQKINTFIESLNKYIKSLEDISTLENIPLEEKKTDNIQESAENYFGDNITKKLDHETRNFFNQAIKEITNMTNFPTTNNIVKGATNLTQLNEKIKASSTNKTTEAKENNEDNSAETIRENEEKRFIAALNSNILSTVENLGEINKILIFVSLHPSINDYIRNNEDVSESLDFLQGEFFDFVISSDLIAFYKKPNKYTEEQATEILEDFSKLGEYILDLNNQGVELKKYSILVKQNHLFKEISSVLNKNAENRSQEEKEFLKSLESFLFMFLQTCYINIETSLNNAINILSTHHKVNLDLLSNLWDIQKLMQNEIYATLNEQTIQISESIKGNQNDAHEEPPISYNDVSIDSLAKAPSNENDGSLIIKTQINVSPQKITGKKTGNIQESAENYFGDNITKNLDHETTEAQENTEDNSTETIRENEEKRFIATLNEQTIQILESIKGNQNDAHEEPPISYNDVSIDSKNAEAITSLLVLNSNIVATINNLDDIATKLPLENLNSYMASLKSDLKNHLNNVDEILKKIEQLIEQLCKDFDIFENFQILFDFCINKDNYSKEEAEKRINILSDLIKQNNLSTEITNIFKKPTDGLTNQEKEKLNELTLLLSRKLQICYVNKMSSLKNTIDIINKNFPNPDELSKHKKIQTLLSNLQEIQKLMQDKEDDTYANNQFPKILKIVTYLNKIEKTPPSSQNSEEHSDLENLQQEHESINNHLMLQKNQLENLKKKEKTLGEHLKENNDQYSKLEEQETSLLNEFNKIKTTETEAQELNDNYKKREQKLQNQIASLNKKIEVEQRNKEKEKVTKYNKHVLNSQEQYIKRLESEKQKFENELKTITPELEQVTPLLNKIAQTLKSLNEQHDSITKAKDSITTSISEIKTKLSEIEAKKESATTQIATLEQQIKIIEQAR